MSKRKCLSLSLAYKKLTQVCLRRPLPLPTVCLIFIKSRKNYFFQFQTYKMSHANYDSAEFQKFLDQQQYSRNGILRWVFRYAEVIGYNLQLYSMRKSGQVYYVNPMFYLVLSNKSEVFLPSFGGWWLVSPVFESV